MIYRSFIFILILFSSLVTANDEIEARQTLANYQWLTEDYPPYNYINENGQLVGIFTDVLLLVYKELNIKLTVDDIHIMPWARLYRNVETNQAFAGFSMVSTIEREKDFRLISLPFLTKISIMVLKERREELKNSSSENFDNLTIAVVRQDIGKHLLDIRNIKAKQVETTSALSMLQMLMHKRVDAIAYEEDVTTYQMNKGGIDTKSIVPLYFLNESYSTFAFNKNTPEAVVQLFSEALERLHERGAITKIREKYLDNQ